MAVFRKRLIFWLLRAYLRRWGKVIILSFILGLVIFFGASFSSKYFMRLLPAEKKSRIGVIGSYTADNLPLFITNGISHGLTRINDDGTIVPDAAEDWEVKDGGKTYSFTLNNHYAFSDGTPLVARDLGYKFANVTIDTSKSNVIVFHLKDAYSPFLVTVSRPIFKKGYIGIGDYKLSGIHLNGNFVESLSISSNKDKYYSSTFVFYPSEEALKHAFALGEVTEARGMTNQEYRGTTFDTFPSAKVTRSIDYSRLVTLFFDTQDAFLSDKKVRNALTYALPDEFSLGQRTLVPYTPDSIYLNHDMLDRKQDMDHAKLLLDAAKTSASASAFPEITIKAATRYHSVAEEIAEIWKNLGLKVKITDEESIPSTFQIYLGDFTLPRDPDQYVLWHSTSPNNITKLHSQRLDKLLEDGRKITDVEERKKIYADFQKYLLDESPAAFLYFPYDYIVARK